MAERRIIPRRNLIKGGLGAAALVFLNACGLGGGGEKVPDITQSNTPGTGQNPTIDAKTATRSPVISPTAEAVNAAEKVAEKAHFSLRTSELAITGWEISLAKSFSEFSEVIVYATARNFSDRVTYPSDIYSTIRGSGYDFVLFDAASGESVEGDTVVFTEWGGIQEKPYVINKDGKQLLFKGPSAFGMPNSNFALPRGFGVKLCYIFLFQGAKFSDFGFGAVPTDEAVDLGWPNPFGGKYKVGSSTLDAGKMLKPGEVYSRLDLISQEAKVKAVALNQPQGGLDFAITCTGWDEYQTQKHGRLQALKFNVDNKTGKTVKTADINGLVYTERGQVVENFVTENANRDVIHEIGSGTSQIELVFTVEYPSSDENPSNDPRTNALRGLINTRNTIAVVTLGNTVGVWQAG